MNSVLSQAKNVPSAPTHPFTCPKVCHRARKQNTSLKAEHVGHGQDQQSILVLFQLISLHLHAIVLIGSNLHLLGTLHTKPDDHTGLQGD